MDDGGLPEGEPVVAGEPAVGGESAVAGEPVVAGEPAVGGESAVDGEPVVAGEPAVGGESAIDGEPVVAGQPAGDASAVAAMRDGWTKIPVWDPDYTKYDIGGFRIFRAWRDLTSWVKESLQLTSRQTLAAHTLHAIGPSGPSLREMWLGHSLPSRCRTSRW